MRNEAFPEGDRSTAYTLHVLQNWRESGPWHAKRVEQILRQNVKDQGHDIM